MQMTINRPSTSLTSKPLSAADHAAVADLFAKLVGVFGKSKFAEMWGGATPDVIREQWAAGLSGFTSGELQRGLKECRTRKFVPNVGEFASFCRPALDPEYAWYEAQDGLRARERGEPGVWSHPAVWRAAKAMSYDLRNSSFKQLRVRWSRLLTQEFERGWGDDVPPVVKRVEHRPTLTPMPAAMRKKLAELNLKISGEKK